MSPSKVTNPPQDPPPTAEPPAEPTAPPAASAEPETNDKKRSLNDNEESSSAASSPPLKQPRVHESKPPQETKQDEDSSEDDESPPSPAFQLPSTKMSEDDNAKFRGADSRRVNDEKTVRAAHGKLLKARNELTKAQAKYEEWWVYTCCTCLYYSDFSCWQFTSFNIYSFLLVVSS